MAKPEGAKNLLAKLALRNGTTVYFPNQYLDALKAEGIGWNNIGAIAAEFTKIVTAAGYSQERINAERRMLIGSSLFESALKTAHDKVLGITEEEEEDEVITIPQDEDDQIQAAPSNVIPFKQAKVLTQEEKDALAWEQFTTDSDYYYGIKRDKGSAQFAPFMGRGVTYVNGFESDEEWDYRLTMRLLMHGEAPVLLVGEGGTGKSLFAKNIAKETGLGYFYCPFDNQTEKEDMIGKVCRKADGSVGFDPGPITLAFEQGGVLHLDEVNMAKAATFAFLRDVTNGGVLIVSTDSGYRVIQPPVDEYGRPKLFIIAAVNPMTGAYVGTNPLSLADLSRFKVVQWGYPSEEKEFKILKTNFPTVADPIIKKLCQFAADVRARKAKDPEKLYTVGTRDLTLVLKCLRVGGVTLRQAAQSVFVAAVKNLMGADEEIKEIENLVQSTFPLSDAELLSTDDDAADPVTAQGLSLA